MASSPEPPAAHESLWIATAPGPELPPLLGNLSVDVAVLGGGIAGLTTAFLLKRAGAKVAVVEAGRIVEGVTGKTTAKVTSNHGAIYAELMRRHGEERTRIYAESNQAALERIASLVAEEGIDCEFERKPAYTYAESTDDLKTIEENLLAAQKVGLPAHYAADTGLPYRVAGAVRFDDQAQFHPRKYLLHLAAQIPGDGSVILGETRALSVDQGSPCRVTTDRGTITARDVVVATHFPFLIRGLYFARIHPVRECVVCPEVDANQDPKGMYVGVGKSGKTIRTVPAPKGLYLVIGGEMHRPGENPPSRDHFEVLEEFARSHFAVDRLAYYWSTQDTYSDDLLPYIGRMLPASEHLYVATGFGGWGMTNGTLSGMIISDLILGVANPWAKLYDPNRVNPGAGLGEFVTQNLKVAEHFVGDRLLPKPRSASAVHPGEGRVLLINGRAVAAYRDGKGKLHAVSAVCTHLHCIVGWNAEEKTWDCPCHGSRFGVDGEVLHAPATLPLPPRDVPDR